MADILGLGVSHYPGLLVPEEFWSSMLQRNVDVGRIPSEVYADVDGWPDVMREEWSDDKGLSAAREHKSRLLAGFKALRNELDRFDPDIVLIWGDDQYENFKTDCIPPFCVYIGDEFVSRPLGPESLPFKTNDNIWGLKPDQEFLIQGHREAAHSLCSALLREGFDLAYAYETRHKAGLAHSFNNTVLYLDYERKGFTYPVIPFHVNCYGNQILKASPDETRDFGEQRSPPSPSPERCFEIGQAVARYFRESQWRVALVASSSWSHASLTIKHDRLYPDIPADRDRLADLQNQAFDTWRDVPLDQIEDAGQNEFLNWICLAGAMSETGQRSQVLDFVESHIFNSSKCFALFPPVAAGGANAGPAG